MSRRELIERLEFAVTDLEVVGTWRDASS